MNIVGEKTILRAIEPKDNPMLYEMINDSETEYMLGGWSFPVSQRNQEDWTNNLRNDIRTLRCCIDAQGEAVGVVMLTEIDFKNGTAEVHIKLAKKQRSSGYGTDALNTIVEYAFSELRLNCIFATISSHNTASRKLFEKCRFKQEGFLKSRLFKKGQYIDVISYSRLKSEE